MNRLELFLKELAELTKKYGLVIGGCGCCGSPWIEDLEQKNYINNLRYNDEKQEYFMEGDTSIWRDILMRTNLPRE